MLLELLSEKKLSENMVLGAICILVEWEVYYVLEKLDDKIFDMMLAW